MEYGTLNPHLIASLYEVDRTGSVLGDAIRVPLTEASLEVSLGWQSPFEAQGPEAVSPTLLAMVQSGAASDFVNALGNSKLGGAAVDAINSLVGQIGGGSFDFSSFVSSGIGRTGLTKMNSTQVFSGMPPIKINATALFRAWHDPRREVEDPFDRLMSWALPQCLKKDSMLVSLAKGDLDGCDAQGGAGFGLDTLLPSLAPKLIGLTYKGRTYKPLVIESIGFPMDSPITADARYTELVVPLSLATWQTFDAKDWIKLREL